MKSESLYSSLFCLFFFRFYTIFYYIQQTESLSIKLKKKYTKKILKLMKYHKNNRNW